MVKVEYNPYKNGYHVLTPMGYVKRYNSKDYSFTYSIHANVFDLGTAQRYKGIIENIIEIMTIEMR